MEKFYGIKNVDVDLQITLFGKFGLSYKGDEVKLGMSERSIGVQILGFLICNAPKGFTEKELIDAICDKNGKASVYSMRVLISKVRKALSNAGIPPETSIVGHSGKFHWQTSVPCYTDAIEFKKAADLALKCEASIRIDLLERACNLYLGEFLPSLQNSPWALLFNLSYINLYLSCLQGLIDECEKASQWERLLPSVSNADHDENYNEWITAAHIRTLIHLGQYDVAKQVYEKAVDRLRNDFDVQPTDLLRSCANEIEKYEKQDGAFNKRVYYNNLKLEINLQERNYVTRENFSAICRAIFQQAKFLGVTDTLIECRLTNRDGFPARDTKLSTKAYEKARNLFANHLRACEVFTEVEQGVYLLLLCNTVQNETSERLKQLSAEYRKHPVRGFHLTFERIM